MDITKAKRFYYMDPMTDKVYTAKNIQTLFDEIEDAKLLCGVFGLVDTAYGQILFDVDFNYDNEPCLVRKFMHIDSFVRFYKNDIIEID